MEDNNRIIGICYALSKMTIIDDMESFDNYNIMKKCEFHEFLGRLAELLFKEDEIDQSGTQTPLIKKLFRLLTILFEKFTK